MSIIEFGNIFPYFTQQPEILSAFGLLLKVLLLHSSSSFFTEYACEISSRYMVRKGTAELLTCCVHILLMFCRTSYRNDFHFLLPLPGEPPTLYYLKLIFFFFAWEFFNRKHEFEPERFVCGHTFSGESFFILPDCFCLLSRALWYLCSVFFQDSSASGLTCYKCISAHCLYHIVE